MLSYLSKNDRSVEIALSPGALINKDLKKTNLQCPTGTYDRIGFRDRKWQSNSTVVNASLQMLNAFGQTVLYPDATKHYNFQDIGRKTTGMYAFKTAHFVPTIMTKTFAAQWT